MNAEDPYPVPLPDAIKDLRRIGCSVCHAIAPFTIHEWERQDDAAQLATGWQLRLILTQVIREEGPVRVIRSDFYCPEHAGVWNPRPDGAWRLRLSDEDRQ